MPTEAQVLASAQAMCNADGRGIKVLDAFPADQGYAINISVPKQPGMTDENWHSVVRDIRDKLETIPGVRKVLLALS